MGKKTLLNQLRDNYEIEDISYCNGCGAYTIAVENGKIYTVHKKNFFKFFPNIDKKDFRRNIKSILCNNFCNCDYCVNHWGLELCACGSGENFETCKGEFDECGKPMQKFGKYSRVVAKGGFFI